MKAARLHQPGLQLMVEEVPEPSTRPGGAVIRIEAVQVLPFTNTLISGALPFDLPTPYTLGTGGIGTVAAVPDDVVGLTVGERVFLDPLWIPPVPGADDTPLLIGWMAMGDGALPAQRRWRDGTFAEYATWPAAQLTPITGLQDVPSTRLACLNYLNIAYGAALRADLEPGGSVVVVGATGNLGTAVVLVALALGAATVVAAGRNTGVLERLAGLDDRIRTVPLSGDGDKDAVTLADAAGGGGADVAIETVGLVDNSATVTAAVGSVRRFGTVVLAGGGAGPVPIAYPMVMSRNLTIRGAFMGPPELPGRLMSMVRAGTLRLDALTPRVFPLDQVNEAVEAAAHGRGLDFTVLSTSDLDGASR